MLRTQNEEQSEQMLNMMVLQIFDHDHFLTLSLENQLRISDQRMDFIQQGIKGFEQMSWSAVLNFTLVVHDIMTAQFASESMQKIMNYLVCQQVSDTMFGIIQHHASDICKSKSAAHILSLISNYYSYSMQNIAIYEDSIPQHHDAQFEYNQEIIKQFEASDFMKSMSKNLFIIKEQLRGALQPDQKLGVLRLKMIEVKH